MKSQFVCGVIIIFSATGYGQIAAPAAATMPGASQKALVTQYCAGCHNEKLKSGGFSWAKIDLAHVDRKAEQAEKAILKLRAGMMPPSGAPRPDAATLKSFAAALENGIDQAAGAHPNPGKAPALHRLNRTEYRNSIRDLLDLDVDVAALLPPDDLSHGFDNMADVLTVSPALMEGYIRAAGKISRLAVGDPTVGPTEKTYHIPRVINQMRHVEGTPIGTRGGISVVHDFPADGEYMFKVAFLRLARRSAVREESGKGSANRSLGEWRARRVAEYRPEHEADGRSADASDQDQGRSAAGFGGVHSEIRRTGRGHRFAVRAEPGRPEQRRYAGHDVAAASARVQHHRSDEGDGSFGHAEPARGFSPAARPRTRTRFRAPRKSFRHWRGRRIAGRRRIRTSRIC